MLQGNGEESLESVFFEDQILKMCHSPKPPKMPIYFIFGPIFHFKKVNNEVEKCGK